ncbi:hypothetical protein EDB81DRAFT_913729 [Dactylonectria macrodidyma]|uniref:Uncharacterized protein n=1 Tax=Dactylonectria macrodidyma TaxID=307937 RepID=A0A9P9DN38_9HYPO|nr:hypothetical protein EDB81DRAFT_913729 [Dactylonectria macrodidyma]
MGAIFFTTTAGSRISIAYGIDFYRDLTSAALTTTMIIRDTMSFGIGYDVRSWVVSLRYQNAFILGACADFAEKYWSVIKKDADLDASHCLSK